jgi:hypothetical protein
MNCNYCVGLLMKIILNSTLRKWIKITRIGLSWLRIGSIVRLLLRIILNYLAKIINWTDLAHDRYKRSRDGWPLWHCTFKFSNSKKLVPKYYEVAIKGIHNFFYNFVS